MTPSPARSASTLTATDVRTAEPTLRGLRAAFWFGGFNGVTWMIALGTPMVLLAQHLGASALQVGLASSFQFLLLPVQILATATLPRFGFKRQMVGAWVTRAVFLLIPLGLAWASFDHPAPWMPDLLVASLFGFCFCRAVGMAAHMPWMAVIVPVALRGRFFATDGQVTSTVGVATLLAAATLFASVEPHAAFPLAYGAALTSGLLAAACLTRLPRADAPAAPPLRAMGRRAWDLCTQPGRFRQYLVVAVTGAIVTPSFGPFTAYYLKVERGLASSEIMLFTAAQFAGSIVGASLLRHRLDRFPIRRFFQVSVAVIAVVDLFWLLVLNGVEVLGPWLGVSYFLFGCGIGMANIAHFTFLPELATDQERPINLAIFTATHGLFTGLTPILWGAVLKGGGSTPSMNLAGFHTFFVAALTVCALLLALYSRLPELRPSVPR